MVTHISLGVFTYYAPNFLILNNCIPMTSYVLTSRLENRVDPYQLTSEKSADLDLHCSKTRHIQVQRGKEKLDIKQLYYV